jgi:hypothetical protein
MRSIRVEYCLPFMRHEHKMFAQLVKSRKLIQPCKIIDKCKMIERVIKCMYRSNLHISPHSAVPIHSGSGLGKGLSMDTPPVKRKYLEHEGDAFTLLSSCA